MSKHIIKIKDGRIIEDPNGFIEKVRNCKDGYYSVGICRPRDANISDIRAAFFAGPVRAWQKKLNESGAVTVFSKVLYYDNDMTYKLLKQLFGEKHQKTGEPLSISDGNDSMNREKMIELTRAAVEGYYEFFGEVMLQEEP